MTKGKWIKCSDCGGHGVVSGYTIGGTDFTGAEECSHCAGGRQWLYPSGHIAQYPGGPMAGRLTAAAAPEGTDG